MSRVLVVAAHPDDEVIGIGGTLYEHAKRKDQVLVLYLADGVTSREAATEKDVESRRTEAGLALLSLGVSESSFLGLPDQRLDTVPLLDIVKHVERVKERIHPDVVYTHSQNDLNEDHRIAFQATVTAFRPVSYASPTIYSYCPIPLSLEPFSPNTFMPLTLSAVKKKIEAMRLYASEQRAKPHPHSLESIEITARYWGSQCGCMYAEPLLLVRHLIRY